MFLYKSYPFSMSLLQAGFAMNVALDSVVTQ